MRCTHTTPQWPIEKAISKSFIVVEHIGVYESDLEQIKDVNELIKYEFGHMKYSMNGCDVVAPYAHCAIVYRAE